MNICVLFLRYIHINALLHGSANNRGNNCHGFDFSRVELWRRTRFHGKDIHVGDFGDDCARRI